MSLLAKAISIAASAFETKTDKGGVPYIMHCLTVMDNTETDNDDVKIAAVLHDLIEDTSWTSEELAGLGFSKYTLFLLDTVTHKKGISYEEYIEDISFVPDAVKIKKADLRHNSDIHRMKGLTDKDFERLTKYHKAYAKLKALS